jgi:hypothetical protein
LFIAFVIFPTDREIGAAMDAYEVTIKNEGEIWKQMAREPSAKR